MNLVLSVLAAGVLATPMAVTRDARPNVDSYSSATIVSQAQDSAAEAALDARARAVASRLRCPFCEGLSIQESPDASAQEMRDIIREQLAAGRSEADVKAYFIDKYTEWVLLEPEKRGFNLVVYVLPALVLLAGATLLFVIVRRWSGAPSTGGTGTIDASDPDLAPWEEIRPGR